MKMLVDEPCWVTAAIATLPGGYDEVSIYASPRAVRLIGPVADALRNKCHVLTQCDVIPDKNMIGGKAYRMSYELHPICPGNDSHHICALQVV